MAAVVYIRERQEGDQLKESIPFTLDRSSDMRLSVQMANSLRRLIVEGFYAAGDILPTLHEFADALGVSMRVPREAFAILEKEGCVFPRPRVGCEVLARNDKVWYGNVLFVLPADEGSYYADVFIGNIRRILAREGYRLEKTAVSGGKDSGHALDDLEAALSVRPTLAIVLYGSAAVEKTLREKSVPFVTVADYAGKRKGSIGNIGFGRDRALSDFVEECVRRKVRDVTVLGFAGNEGEVDPSSLLEEKKIRVRKHELEVEHGEGFLLGVQRAAFSKMRELLSEGRDTVYFFPDDFVALGALHAISLLGEEKAAAVKFATWSNKGFAPLYFLEPARLEMDPVAHGRTVGEAIVRYLQGGVLPKTEIGSVFLPGETLAGGSRKTV
jgi:DNA-binding LacI/PurR family transcriptional regulator